ncbi:hypothetical protein [Sphingomonas aerolata]|uniref:hypothetical protein n=1 Tax=Sphingomonas aerolata TaxID=185951 RepID=UPI00141BD2F0|nr:hypothetical protein [Sphingomonas aerolata]NII59825.1 hypothetical protein [Sphingomonas aerolata]
MSVIATAVKHLLAAGVTGDALVAAIADMEANAPAPVVVEAGPSKAALRQRRYAERQKASATVISDVSDASVTESVSEPAPSPPPLLPPQTPPITPPPLPHPEGFNASTRKARASAWPCPDGVDPQHWADVLANRKSKRLANTSTAFAGILRDIEKFSDEEWPPGRIVQHAAERGWGAIFDPRPQNGNRNGKRPDHQRRSGNGFLDAVIDAERDDRARPSI